MKILIWDIETLPMETYTWDLHPYRLSHDNIIHETTIACVAFKWLGEEEVYQFSISPKDPRNDFQIVVQMWEVISQADVLVAHYGDKFDLRKLNARIAFWHLPPPKPVLTVDTWKVAKKHFGFDSNRLDYLGRHLFGEGKIHTSYELWKEVLKGSEKALSEMVAYNKQDVRLLERVYLHMRPWMTNHPNMALEYPGYIVCPVCGSTEWQHRGTRMNKTTINVRYQCQVEGCRKWFSSTSSRPEKAIVKP